MRYILAFLFALCGFQVEAATVFIKDPATADTIGAAAAVANTASATLTRATSGYNPDSNTICYVDARRTRSQVIGTTTYSMDLIEGQRTNLLLRGTSECFDVSAAWAVGTGVPTVTADSVASPTGATTAETFTEGTTNGLQEIKQSITKAASSISYAETVYIKNASGTRSVVIELDDGTTTNGVAMTVNPVAGTITSSPAAFGSGWTVTTTGGTSGSAVESAGSSWYRYTLVATSDTTTTVRMRVALYNGSTSSYAGDGTSGVYLWGGDVEAANFASSYISNRNVMTQTQTLGTSWNANRCSVTSNAVADPITGNTTAEEVVEDSTATQTHWIGLAFTKASAASYTMTASVYAKANARTWICVTVTNSGTALTNSAGAYFDLGGGATGSNVTSGSGYAVTSKAITSVGSGWYRCSVTVTTDSAATTAMGCMLASADNGRSYSGNGASSAYFWGAQLQYGPTATTYWANTSTVGQRALDSLSSTTSVTTATGTIGVVMRPYGWTGNPGVSVYRAMQTTSGTGTDLEIRSASSGPNDSQNFSRADAGGSHTLTSLSATTVSGVNTFLSGTWNATEMVAYQNGPSAQVFTTLTAPYVAVPGMSIGSSATPSLHSYCYILCLVWPTALPRSSEMIFATGIAP